MSEKIEAFITEVRTMPAFVAASANDPKWLDELDAIERGLAAIYRNADMTAAFDEIQAVLDRRDLSMKQRLLEIGRLLLKARDAGRSEN